MSTAKKTLARNPRKLRYGRSPEELLAMMPPEKRALAEKIDEIRRGLGDEKFNVTQTIRKIRNTER